MLLGSANPLGIDHASRHGSRRPRVEWSDEHGGFARRRLRGCWTCSSIRWVLVVDGIGIEEQECGREEQVSRFLPEESTRCATGMVDNVT